MKLFSKLKINLKIYKKRCNFLEELEGEGGVTGLLQGKKR